jgi:GT2 family glycosyltransferase
VKPVKHTSAELSLSVVIPVHNGGENFRRCLASLKESLRPPDEIIVVVDGDTDESWQFAQEFATRVFRFPSPRGPGRARNLGAAHARGEVLLFIDADVMVQPQAIDMVISAFEGEPQLDALFGSYDDEPSEPNFLSQYRNLLHHYVHQHGREDASTFWGACGAIRRDVFLSIGGFDERYARPSIEDIELGYRLKKAGSRIRLYKSLQVKHLKRWSLGSMLQADFFHRALPWTELILRDRNLINDLNTSISGRASVALTFLLVGLLFLSCWQPLALAGVGSVAVILLVVNASLYRFFLKKRGYLFAIQSVLGHWLYFLYSGVAFAIGTVRHGTSQDGLAETYSSRIKDGAESAGSPMERP